MSASDGKRFFPNQSTPEFDERTSPSNKSPRLSRQNSTKSETDLYVNLSNLVEEEIIEKTEATLVANAAVTGEISREAGNDGSVAADG